jgi:hypothetical protein
MKTSSRNTASVTHTLTTTMRKTNFAYYRYLLDEPYDVVRSIPTTQCRDLARFASRSQRVDDIDYRGFILHNAESRVTLAFVYSNCYCNSSSSSSSSSNTATSAAAAAAMQSKIEWHCHDRQMNYSSPSASDMLTMKLTADEFVQFFEIYQTRTLQCYHGDDLRRCTNHVHNFATAGSHHDNDIVMDTSKQQHHNTIMSYFSDVHESDVKWYANETTSDNNNNNNNNNAKHHISV